MPAAATPATAAATVATAPAVAPAALPPAPADPAPEDAPPACAIALLPTIAKKIIATNFFIEISPENLRSEFDGPCTLTYPVKALQHGAKFPGYVR